MSTVSNEFIRTSIISTFNNSKFDLNFLIVPRIADAVPNETFPRHLFNIPSNLRLADEQFHVSKPINILLASHTTLSILSAGQVKLQRDRLHLVLQKSALGWIAAGGLSSVSPSPYSFCNITKLDKAIERF